MKIATISFNSIWENKLANLAKVEKIINSLKGKAQYVIFPEMTFSGFSMDNIGLAENINESNLIREIIKLAKDYQINILFGLMTKKENKKYNSCICINSNGEIECIYDKIHLFSYSGEDALITPGILPKSIQWKGGWGLSICYDLRFPELYQQLSKSNLILVNIANWPNTRITHWKTLLKARSIENQSFMIGVNRTGSDGNGLEYEESSLIFSPSGEEIYPLEISDEIKIFDLDLNIAIDSRERFPFKNDRKKYMYKNFYN
jgi:omega-amidase